MLGNTYLDCYSTSAFVKKRCIIQTSCPAELRDAQAFQEVLKSKLYKAVRQQWSLACGKS